MKHCCTVPMSIGQDQNGDPTYILCGKKATYTVANSSWSVCEEHANTIKAEGCWDLIKMEEA